VKFAYVYSSTGRRPQVARTAAVPTRNLVGVVVRTDPRIVLIGGGDWQRRSEEV
jgi:hypothetical protein